MDIFGIGPLEIIFILLIALLILGPSDMVKTGRAIGSFLRKLVTSPNWRVFTEASREIRNLPNKLMREAGLDEDIADLKELSRQADLQPDINNIRAELNDLERNITSWTTPPPGSNPLKAPKPTPPPKESPSSPQSPSNETEQR